MRKLNLHLSNTWVISLALCLLVGWVYFLPVFYNAFMDKKVEGKYANADFYAYYIAGKAYNMGVDPYIDHRFEIPELNNPRIDGFSGYIYPPTALPLYALIARLHYNPARLAWALLNLGVYLAVFAVILAQAKPERRARVFMIAALLLLTSYPVLTHLGQGQVDMLVCGLSLLAYMAYQKGRQWTSAVLLSLGVFIKVNPIMLLAALVLYTWDIKYLLRFGLVFALLFAASLLYAPFGQYVEFIRLVLPDLSGGRSYFTNQSFIRLVAYQGAWPSIVAFSGMAFISIFCLGSGWRRRRAPQSLPDAWLASEAVFLMNTLTLLLFSGHAWTMAYVWLLPTLTRLLDRLWDDARPGFLALVALATVLINANVVEVPFLKSQNLIGATLLMVLMVVLVVFPRLAVRQNVS